MKITLAEAAHDEYNQTGYEAHQKGDQTGDEVRFHDYYQYIGYKSNQPWTRVYRPLDANCANAIAIRMEQSVRNANVGYGQPARNTFIEALLRDPDPSHIKTKVDVDCSGLVNSIVKVTYREIGHTLPLSGYETTAMMPGKYDLMTQHFKNVIGEVDLATGRGLKRGDILVRPMCHTAVVVEVEEDTAPAKRTGTVSTDLYLRKGAGAWNRAICTMKRGETVTILGRTKIITGAVWYQVQYKSHVGYCSAKYISG